MNNEKPYNADEVVCAKLCMIEAITCLYQLSTGTPTSVTRQSLHERTDEIFRVFTKIPQEQTSFEDLMTIKSQVIKALSVKEVDNFAYRSLLLD
jgi:hypothetical protein